MSILQNFLKLNKALKWTKMIILTLAVDISHMNYNCVAYITAGCVIQRAQVSWLASVKLIEKLTDQIGREVDSITFHEVILQLS